MANSNDVGAELGQRFVDALATKDRAALADLFDPKIDFRGLTPSQEWRAVDPDGVVEIVLGSWFEPSDHVREAIGVAAEPFADRYQLRYRLRVESDGVMYVVEQQGYYSAEEGRITRMGVVCSGFRPL